MITVNILNGKVLDGLLDCRLSSPQVAVRRIATDRARVVEHALHDEAFLLVHRGKIELDGAALGALTLAIVPAGEWVADLSAGTDLYVITTTPEYGAACSRNDVYAPRNDGLSIVSLPDLPYPSPQSRLKMVQTARLSLNWVDYDGPRDRSTLSPHSHADFSQLAIVLEGAFVHHLRHPWGPDAESWQDDQHLSAGPASVTDITPPTIHTSEGVGLGPHRMVEIFAPPRQDFIEKGWMSNAGDYRPLRAGP